MSKNHTLWVEKYRPQQLDNYVGNDMLKDKVKLYLDSGDLPHLLLYGKAGTGKTTLAKLLELCSYNGIPRYESDYLG